TYSFLSGGGDSLFVNFVITKQGLPDTALIIEKTGDWGLVKQANAADTLKTIYFRARITNSDTGSFVANLTVSANVTAMWKLADSIVNLMTLQQRLENLYSWTTVPNLVGFGADDITLSDGRVVVGWRSSDGPNGIRFPVTGPKYGIYDYGSGNPATVFATEAALGCTWDTAMAVKVGDAIGQEARANGLFCNLGPMCDLVINPRWGRAFETMGEDPYLNGKMVSHQVKGIQSEHVIATPKHFTPYCKEDQRAVGQRIIISERALRELPLVPFEMALNEGGARGLMTCYNKVQVPGFTITDPTLLAELCDRAASDRHTINDIVRNGWGWNGVIMTDWTGAIGIDETYCFNTPFDMSMPDGAGFTSAVTNINAGLPGWTVDTLNKKVHNVMYDKLWAWNGKLLANDAAINTYPTSAICSQDHLNITLQEARESIVLAKNDMINGVPALPIDKTASLKVAVIGAYSVLFRAGGGGSSAVLPDTSITPWQGIQTLLAANPASKVTLTNDYTTNPDVAIVFVGVDVETEDADRTDMVLGSAQLDMVSSVMAAVKRTIVVYTGGSASVAGSWSTAPGVIIAFYPGRNQAQALAEILFGDVNPSGHLSVTFPNTVNDLPSYDLVNLQINYPSADTGAGYFYFEKTKKTPLFWFGHGLSYTTFAYTGMSITGGASITAGDRVDVSVTVQNTGSRDGDEVVQLYVRPQNTSTPVPRRAKDLRGFCRVTIPAGQSKAVTFT
ncbi:MAG: glycoside hydrolase family 3 C-terminal domain-containing protein, partial [Chitinivibrionales bacterium]